MTQHWLVFAALLCLACFIFLVVYAIYASITVRWTNQRTMALRYYGLSARKRRVFRGVLKIHAFLLTPLFSACSRWQRFQFSDATFQYHGVAGPRGGACSPDSFENAVRYVPRQDDVFVVTQMRSGTTWMQHLVFQILTRGTRDLAEDRLPLNAVSPWLESDRTITTDQAPKVGDGIQKRIIKTHLPASCCPWSAQAKYIYVIRHPVSCFASCCDFVRNNLRGFTIETDDCLRWFCSQDLMWWNCWVEHVNGWHSQAAKTDNILFVRYEDMKDDLTQVAKAVSQFLDLPALDQSELEAIVAKCSFTHMKQNAEVFEMHPPHLLQTPEKFFQSGKSDRYADVSRDVFERIAAWCHQGLGAACQRVYDYYPDLKSRSGQRASIARDVRPSARSEQITRSTLQKTFELDGRL